MNLAETFPKYLKEAIAEPLSHDVQHEFCKFEVEAKREFAKQQAGVYPEIDLSFLSMADDKGLPKFAIFYRKNKDAYMSMRCSFNRGNKRNPVSQVKNSRENMICNLPTNLRNNTLQKSYLDNFESKFEDMMLEKAKLTFETEKYYRMLITISISQSFYGMIPINIKNKVQSLMDKGIIKDWFLISESIGWTVDEQVEEFVTESIDPLVIGVTDNNNPYVLIDNFDLSPIEEMVKREFTT